MRTISFFLILYALSCALGCAEKTSFQKVNFNERWEFTLADSLIDFSTGEQHTANWRTLDLPHDWSVEGTFSKEHPAGTGGGALPGGIGWYRKSFRLNEEERKKVVRIQFDGIYQHSSIWINGHLLGQRPNGYISFSYDLSPYLHQDDRENTLLVKADNARQPNSRWYSGSGIYRPVWLLLDESFHLDQEETFIQSRLSEGKAAIHVDMTFKNEERQAVDFRYEIEVLNPEGKSVVTWKSPELSCAADSNRAVGLEVDVPDPQLWSVDKPDLYTFSVKLIRKKQEHQAQSLRFGLRHFNFDAEKGFSLNGAALKIQGVCNHHDLGALGAAVHRDGLKRQLHLLKDMGCNAIRTAHNPPSPELLDLCDEMGFLVMDEAFDIWSRAKSEFDYHLNWKDWHVRDLTDLIKRDRNHPSVIIWSIGNEIPEQNDSAGFEIARELRDIVRGLDTTRPVTAGLNEPYPYNAIYRSDALDLVGFNYHHQDFEAFPKNFPGKKFIATETTSALQTRGYFEQPADTIRRWPYRWDLPFLDGNPDHTVSAYDHVSTPWGSTHEETLKLIHQHDFLSGMFVWTGFDYLGEPTPYTWPARSSYFGIIDIAGIPKDVYHLYKSVWSQDTVLHLLPHWNWAESKVIDVWAYYNQADEVELFLNGRSLGSRSKRNDELHVSWKVPFEAGELKAVSRKNGQLIAETSRRTASTPQQLQLEVDPNQEVQSKKKGDLIYLTLDVLDKDGIEVPDACREVLIETEGPVQFLAAINGDPTSHRSFQSARQATFNGKLSIILKVTEESAAGGILRISSNDLTDSEYRM